MSAARPRIEAVDAARGVALLAMGVYHFVWDLSYFQFIPLAYFFDPRFQFFGDVIAVSFLALVGVSLVLAARGGVDFAAYLKRTALVAGAAALVSLGTYLFMPAAFISFGILHCIAAASLLALAFLRARWFWALLAGAAIVAAPLAFATPALDAWNWSLGLGVKEPLTLDWRPLFPWTGFTLIGLGLAQYALVGGVPQSLAQWRARGAVMRVLSFGGRHSLAVYLLHQPPLLAIVFIASLASANFGAVGPRGAAPEANFHASCTQACAAAGAQRAFCEQACACVARESQNAGLWPQVLRDALDVEERKRFDAITRVCMRPDSDLIR